MDHTLKQGRLTEECGEYVLPLLYEEGMNVGVPFAYSIVLFVVHLNESIRFSFWGLHLQLQYRYDWCNGAGVID